MQIFSLLQGSEAQRTTDLLLLRFSSHWPHPLSFNRFAFAAHAALPLFTFCLFPHVQNVRLLLYLCSRFSASAFVPLYRHILKSLLISFITFPGSRRTFEAPPLQILPQEFPPRLSLSPSEYFPRAEPLRSFTETFLSLHQENLLRFSRSTLRSGVLSLFTYILAPSIYFVNSFFEDFIFYLYILFSQNEA